MDAPKLRKVDRIPLQRGDESLLVLHDPLEIAEAVALDAELGPLLDRMDGTRSLPQLRQSLLLGAGLRLDLDDLGTLVRDLSGAGLLDDEAFRARRAALAEDFLSAPTRPPRLPGVVLPDTPHELRALLHDALPDPTSRATAGSPTVGLLTPHLPPDLAAPVLAPVLRALPAPDELDLVVLLGADLYPGLLPFAATAKDYQTPLGPVPTCRRTLPALERAVPWIRREELRHRAAASLEMAATYLRHIYGERLPPVLPLLCGRAALQESEAVELVLGSLESVTDGRRVLWWASAELSHTGAAYGSPDEASARAAEADPARLDLLAAARPEAFVRGVGGDAAPSSGAPAMATLLRMLPVGAAAAERAYARVDVSAQARVGVAALRFAITRG